MNNCQICGAMYDDGEGGTLIDQNGHRWPIGPECIAALWKENQQQNQIAAYEARIERSIDETLALLRENLLKGRDGE